MTVNHGVPGSSPGEGAKRREYYFFRFKITKAADYCGFFVFRMHYVYILHSLRTGKYYAGESPDVEVRLAFHNDPIKNTNSTKSGIPWELFWTLKVSDRSLARKIELHIKNMKSVKYYQNLKEYPEISEKLIQKYSS